MRKLLAVVTLAALSAGAALAQAPAEAWRIGPIIKGRNYSVGMPAALEPGPQGPTFAFPREGEGHVHYVSLATGPLEGATTITVHYRVDAARGVRFVAQENGEQGALGLVFQRAGDTWSAKGRYEAYRWYSPIAVPLAPGVHTFTARLDDPAWVGVLSSRSGSNPQGFAGALADTETVSLTFGSQGARGHGVYATAPARFTILDFRID
jgi:hypothetical protein